MAPSRNRPGPILVLAALTSAWAGSPDIPRAAPAIEFHWPIPAKFAVTAISANDSSRVVMRWDASVHATPHPDELRVRSGRCELLEGGSASASAMSDEATAGLEALLQQSPPVTINRKGEFVRFSGMKEVMDGVLGWMRSSTGGAIDSAGWSRIEAYFQSPQVTAQMSALAAETWNLWAGHWLGLDLEPGEAVEGEMPFLIGGATLPAKVTLANHGPTGVDKDLVWLEMETTLEGEEVRAAVERQMRSMSRDIAGQDLPDEKLLRVFRRVDHATVLIEPQTARPSYASSSQEIEVTPTTGDRQTKITSAVYYFEWDPPLGRKNRRDPMPDSALTWYNAARFEEAEDVLARAVAEGSRNPDVHAYFAEVQRRKGSPGLASIGARRALSLQPRHAFAHEVLARAYDPRDGSWRRANADSTWSHLLQGIDCDSTDGNLWLSTYLEAVRRGRGDLERRSLRGLQSSRFFTPATVAYARWMLRDLPDSVVLLTNGDLDSYPAWMLQDLERVRPDVAVVNRHMLNLPWYARHVRDRLRVSLPFQDAALDSLQSTWNPDSTVLEPSGQIVNGWLGMQRAGALPRPLFVSLTVSPPEFTPALEGRLTLSGAAYRCAPDTAAGIDTVAVRRSLSGLVPKDFAGPVVSERDRSPIRRSRGSVIQNIIDLGIGYADFLLQAGRREDAKREIRRAEEMAQGMGATAKYAEPIAALKEAAARKPTRAATKK